MGQVVAITTDGASIMIRLGKDIEPLHQVCIAHAIHLEVCDVIYKKKKDTPEEELDWIKAKVEG